MDLKLKHALDTINTNLVEVLDDLKNYSNEVLNTKPSPEAWSVLQVLNHLLRVEELSFKYVKKKLSYNPTLKKAGGTNKIRMIILNLYLRSPFKWKAPKGVDESHFPEVSDFKEVSEKWLKMRRELENYLSALPKEIFDKQVYKHPLAGRMTLEGMVAFYKVHFDRHREQIERTLKMIEAKR